VKQTVISGMGLFLPMGKDLPEVKRNVMNFTPAFHQGTDRFSTDKLKQLPCSIFRQHVITDRPKEYQPYDPSTYFIDQAVASALDDAGLDLDEIPAHRICCLGGNANIGLQALYHNESSPSVFAFNEHTSFLQKKYGFTGPSLDVLSACAASNTAIGFAALILDNDMVDAVIVTGGDYISEPNIAGFQALGAATNSRSYPFSDQHGINLGEGGIALVMERKQSVQQRQGQIWGEVLGIGLSGDAYHPTRSHPEGDGVFNAMSNCVHSLNIDKKAIDYVNFHGTGTLANDAVESHAVNRFFGGRAIKASSWKSFVGHMLGAAGIVEVCLSLLMINARLVPAGMKKGAIREGMASLEYLFNQHQTITEQTHEYLFMSNNSAFGGNNSSLVIRVDFDAEYAPYAKRRLLVEQEVFINRRMTTDYTGANLVVKTDTFSVYNPSHEGKPNGYKKSLTDDYFHILKLMEQLPKLDEKQNNRRHGIIAGVCFKNNKVIQFVDSVKSKGADLASSKLFSLCTANALAGYVSAYYQLTGYNTTLASPLASIYYSYLLIKSRQQDSLINLLVNEFEESELGHVSDQLNALHSIEQPLNIISGAAAIEFGNISHKNSLLVVDMRYGGSSSQSMLLQSLLSANPDTIDRVVVNARHRQLLADSCDLIKSIPLLAVDLPFYSISCHFNDLIEAGLDQQHRSTHLLFMDIDLAGNVAYLLLRYSP
jgi:3-oxoacyl-(acyl-carrier-protein) synthase